MAYYKNFIIKTLNTIVGEIPQITGKWDRTDKWNAIKVRWNIGRMNYKTKQGLYAIGNPNPNSDIFVTANFKLSFDHLRKALDGIDAWILVLDTKGINVWCAAGKGTFGTKELIYRIKAHQLNKLVEHYRIIVPQLGAVGVSAHEVKIKTGFRIIYGPIKASDIKQFIANNYKTSPEMRLIKFPLIERIKLIPVELTYGKYYLLIVPFIFFLISGISSKSFALELMINKGTQAILFLFAGYITGCAIVPALLPFIPFRSFALKGAFAGLITSILLFLVLKPLSNIEIAIWSILITSISSFMAMNFTGASTYTSLSGVNKEMQIALPLQIIAAFLGSIGFIITRFI